MRAAYPILLDVSEKRAVIVGGGAVGLRKAVKLLDCGAREVVVVSLAFVEGFPTSVVKVAEPFEPRHLSGAALVFAATDSADVNRQVVDEAGRLNVWVSRADEEGGDFTLPAVMRKAPVTVGIWAESPGLSARIRDGIAEKWDERWTLMATAMQVLRPVILASGLNPVQRRELLGELVSEESLDRLSSGGMKAVADWLGERMKGMRNG